MNETTQQALEQFVQKMLTAVEQGASWTAEQAPLVVQEWLRWQMVEAASRAALMVVLCVVFGWLSRRCLAKMREHSLDPWEVPAGLAAVVSLVSGVLAGVAALDALKVYLAPRVVVLEKFVDLIK